MTKISFDQKSPLIVFLIKETSGTQLPFSSLLTWFQLRVYVK